MDKNRIIAIKADFDAVVHCFENSAHGVLVCARAYAAFRLWMLGEL